MPDYIKVAEQERHMDFHVESFYGPDVGIAFRGVPLAKT